MFESEEIFHILIILTIEMKILWTLFDNESSQLFLLVIKASKSFSAALAQAQSKEPLVALHTPPKNKIRDKKLGQNSTGQCQAFASNDLDYCYNFV